jgi:hypothetical protein
VSLDFLSNLFKNEEKFILFPDPFSNFTISIPQSWKFDSNVVIDEGRYSICFEKPNREAQVCIYVDTNIISDDFETFAKKRFNDPSSGSLGTISLSSFQKQKCLQKSFTFRSSSLFDGKIIALKKKNFYEIIIHQKSPLNENLSKEVEKILSSIILK